MAGERFNGKLVSPKRAGFPKVDARAKLVVLVGALPKIRLTSKNLLSYLLFRAMEAKNKSRQEFIKRRTTCRHSAL